MARKSQTKEPRIIENQVNDSSDEEIDEDAAFNSDDELKYGEFFVKKKRSCATKHLTPNNESEESGSDDDDDSSSNDSSDEHSKDWASDDSDEENDGGQYMLDLLNNLDKQVPGNEDESKSKSKNEKYNGRIRMENLPAAAVQMSESQFGASLVSIPSSSGASKDNKLTLDSLMSGISDTQGFTQVQRTMRVLSSGKDNVGRLLAAENKNVTGKQLETTPAPVPRVVSERASRKVHYEATTEDVSQWKDVIHNQRDAETLDFRVNKGGAKASGVTKDGLIDKFEARTEFEEELAKALEVAGMDDEKAMEMREKKRLGVEDGFEDDGDLDDDLGCNRISVEEYKKRHGELAKMRALMFYEEQKRHRINKIKSKKYRKIQKRKREREKDAEKEGARLDDPNNSDREKQEKEEMDRMKERMTLAHKNTSKWARRVLRRGAKMDQDERRALSLQIAKGDELRRKVMGEESGGEESNDEGDTEGALLRKARDILVEKCDVTEDSLGKRKGLFDLDFMKRGMEAQRVRAKDEARRLLEELEANEVAMPTDSDDSDNESPSTMKPAKPKVASEEETSKVLPDGKLVATTLEFGKSDAFGVATKKNDDDNEKTAGEGEVGGAKNSGQTSRKKRRKNKAKDADKETSCEQMQMEEEENPWLAATKNASSNGNDASNSQATGRKKKSKAPSILEVDINVAASMLIDAPIEKKQSNGVETVEETDKHANGNSTKLVSLSQAELVKQAFASPDDLEAEKEFQEEKERMKDRDDPTRQTKEEKTVSGWGSWAGAGAPPPRKPRKLPKHLSAPVKKVERPAKRKDDGISTVIINEKRQKKIAQFQMAEIPYPYKSRQEYEKAIAGNLGHEWNTMNGVKEMTRPSVVVRAGKVIKPISKKAKAKRAPAKF